MTDQQRVIGPTSADPVTHHLHNVADGSILVEDSEIEIDLSECLIGELCSRLFKLRIRWCVGMAAFEVCNERAKRFNEGFERGARLSPAKLYQLAYRKLQVSIKIERLCQIEARTKI